MQRKLQFTDIQKIVGVHRARNLTYIELYKKFFMWVMDRQLELDKKDSTRWMANISSPVLYMLTMAVYGMYQDSKTAFEVYKKVKRAKGESLTAEEQAAYDAEVEKANEVSLYIIDLFESIYDKCDGSEEFDKSVLDAIIVGNGFWSIWYEKSQNTYTITGKDGKKESIQEKISIPNISRIIPLNFFTELSAPSQQKAKINIIRKIKTANRIKADYGIYGIKFAPSQRNEANILEKKDWNMVFRFMMFNNMPFVTTKINLWLSNADNTSDGSAMHTDIWSDNSFEIGQDLHEVYEVHTDETIQVFVDGEDLGWLFARLWPWKKKPVYKIGFRDGLNGLYDIGVWYVWYNYAKTIDWFLNMRIDNDRLTASAPMIINEDESFFDWFDQVEQYPNKLIKVKDVTAAPKRLDFGSMASSVANTEIDMLAKSVQDALWVPWYKLGVQQKVERSAKGVNELIESADASMKSFISSIAKAKWFIAKYVTLLALEYMDDVTLEEMSGSSNLKEFITLTDFINDYSFNFNMESLSSLRERKELEILRGIMRDYDWATRPDGSPIIDKEYGVKMVVEKSWADPRIVWTEEEAQAYMKKQIQSNAEMKKLEAESMPPMAPWADWSIPPAWGQWIIPPVWVQAQVAWAASAPWVQSGSLWVDTAMPMNPDGTNWQVS